MTEYSEWGWSDAAPSHVAHLLWPAVERFLKTGGVGPLRILDIGCGNGYFAGSLLELGHTVVGVDLSEKGIELARKTHPRGRFECLSPTENLLAALDEKPFDVVLSTEVIEHLYDPWIFGRTIKACLVPGGRVILSTPYHGYLKNVAIALTGKCDGHANPLHTGGHIKFFSTATIRRFLGQSGFVDIELKGVGRVPLLWMSMVVSARRV